MGRRVVFFAYGGPEVLRLIEEEPPEPGVGEIRVRVRAAGVNPVDCKIRSGAFAAPGDTFPQSLGNEFAGVVDAVGPGVASPSVGDEVLGFTVAAAYADHVVVPAGHVTAKPAGLPWEVAGALSAVGQTAHHAVRELGVAPGETLLVHAAAGGVGTVAVQLARDLGARVIGTARPRNHGYLRELGAIPVAYGPGLAERVRAIAPEGVDAALDAVGGEAITVSLALVRDRRRIGTLVDDEAAKVHGIRRLRGARSAGTLAELAARCASGALRLPVTRRYPLAAAADAHREMETGHVRGKIVLTLE